MKRLNADIQKKENYNSELTKDFNAKDKELVKTMLQKEDCERSNNEIKLRNDNLEMYVKQLEKEREALNEKN